MSTTHKQLAGYQRRTLRSIREKLLRMAGEWDEIDQFNMNQLAELADQAEKVAAHMVDDQLPSCASTA